MAEQRQLSVEDLNIAEAYQRTMIGHQINKIAKRYDDDAFGSLLVGRRKDGTYWVVDGLQRLSAARKIGRKKVPCRIFESEGPQHEAAVFRKVNKDRSNVNAVALFKALLAEGDEEAIAIQDAVASVGLKIRVENGKGAAWPWIKCVRSAQRCYGRGGADHLIDTLRVICDCWGGEDDALRGDIIDGMSLFLHKCDDIDRVRLVKKLRTTSVADVLRFASGVRKLISSSTRPAAIAQGLLKFYNAGLREKRELAVE